MSIVVVTSAPVATAFATLDSVKAELGLTDTAQDARLTDLIAQASGAIVTFCGRQFAQQSVTETFRSDRIYGRPHGFWGRRGFADVGTGSDVLPLVLAILPVTEITSVTEAGTTVLDSTSYECDMDAGLLYRLSGDVWRPWLSRSVAVEYTAGYVMPGEEGANLPADLTRACIDTVKALWFAGGSELRDPMIKTDSVAGIGSTTWADPSTSGSGIIPPQACATLASYRSVRV